MAKFEELKREACVRGISPSGLVAVVDAQWFGCNVVQLTYRDAAGRVNQELMYRDRQAGLEIVSAGKPWTFDAEGAILHLVSETCRIDLLVLLYPVLAIHTSLVQPLPNQISAVYRETSPKRPLCFLPANDPAVSQTIMAGPLIKGSLFPADLHRCMTVCSGGRVEQWQDALQDKFQLLFEIFTNDKTATLGPDGPLPIRLSARKWVNRVSARSGLPSLYYSACVGNIGHNMAILLWREEWECSMQNPRSHLTTSLDMWASARIRSADGSETGRCLRTKSGGFGGSRSRKWMSGGRQARPMKGPM